jgi:two-component system cell cycle sensor histidine kinase/response regulator CckA
LAVGRKPGSQREVFDLTVVVEKQLALLRPLIPEDIEVVALVPNRAVIVEADQTLLAQAIMNLAINARDAMPAGGKLTVQVDHGPGTAIVEVRDTGTGMDAVTRQRLFEPFFTTKPVGQGTGLGLALVYRAIQEMAGSVEVDSALGLGSAFRMIIPATDRPVPQAVSQGAADLHAIRPATILVVEDEPALLELIARSLRDAGHNVVTAANGNEALAVQDNDDLDIEIMLTDVVMPELDGVRLAQLARSIRPELRVLFMTGYADRLPEGRAEQLAGEVVLPKPLDLSRLQQQIQDTLFSRELA